MRCCLVCFEHTWIRDLIKRESTVRGTCGFCGARRSPLIDLDHLYKPFKNLCSMYARVDQVVAPGEDAFERGESLFYLIQDSYQVFSERVEEKGRAEDLLFAILQSGWEKDDGEDPLDRFELFAFAKPFYESSLAEDWQQFCSEVRKHPNADDPFYRFLDDDLARTEVRIPANAEFLRARKCLEYDGESGEPLPCGRAKMGPPPKTDGKGRPNPPGRANCEGRSVLYCADQKATAISESRPWNGLYISIAVFRASVELRLLDLVNGLPEVNPFESESPLYDSEFAELMRAFAEELSRPLIRADDPTDYLPSQRLASYIESRGFDGIRYPSAMRIGGSNVVFFDPKKLEFVDSSLVQIMGIKIDFEERGSDTP